MKLLAVVTPPFIYHGCSTWNMFWEEEFTLGKFTPVNMKNCGRRNVSKHGEIKNGERYTTLGILLEFGILENIKTTSSEPKYYLRISEKRLIIFLGIKTVSSKKKSQGMPLLMSV